MIFLAEIKRAGYFRNIDVGSIETLGYVKIRTLSRLRGMYDEREFILVATKGPTQPPHLFKRAEFGVIDLIGEGQAAIEQFRLLAQQLPSL